MATEGKQTSEYADMKDTSLMAWVGTVVGVLMAVIPIISQNFAPESLGATIAGIVLVVVSQLSKLLNSLGYQKSRSTVKAAEFTVKAAEALKENPTVTSASSGTG